MWGQGEVSDDQGCLETLNSFLKQREKLFCRHCVILTRPITEMRGNQEFPQTLNKTSNKVPFRNPGLAIPISCINL